VEVYNAFLEKVGEITLLVEHQRQPIGYDSEEVARKFNDMGLLGKLDRIDTGLEQIISPELRKMIESVNHARNCMEHRRGIVQERDFHGNEALVVSWRGTNVFRRSTTGVETTIETLPVVLEPGEALGIKMVNREKQFQLGETISFSPVDASEIGLTFFLHSHDIVKAIRENIGTPKSDVEG